MFLVVVITLLACMVFCHDFDGGDVGKALTTICYTGLGFGALTILRFLGLRFNRIFINDYNFNRCICIFWWF